MRIGGEVVENTVDMMQKLENLPSCPELASPGISQNPEQGSWVQRVTDAALSQKGQDFGRS